MRRHILFELVLGRIAACAVTFRWKPEAPKRVGALKMIHQEPKLMREEQRQRPQEARN